MEKINRIKQLMERVFDPTLNNGKLLTEANDVSFANYWSEEKQKTKKKMWDYIVKARTSNPELYKSVTPRHVDFLIEVFGTKFGPQMDPNAAVNLLKNPDRFVSKVNDYFSKTTNNQNATGLDNLEKVAAAELHDDSFISDMFHSDLVMLRQAYLSNFKKFLAGRDAWRAKVEKEDLTNKVISYYIPNSAKDQIKFTGVGKAKVLIDFSYMGPKQEKIFEKLAGELPDLVKNKDKAISEADIPDGEQADSNQNTEKSIFDIAALKQQLANFVLMRSNNTKRNMIMSKRNVVPSNAVIVSGPVEPVEPDNPDEPTDPFEDLINGDPNAKRWFETPLVTFEDGKLFINAFEAGENKGIMNKLFRAVTKGNYYSNDARQGLEDYGFKFSGDDKDKDIFSQASYAGATDSINRFLENGSKSIQHITKKDGSKYYLNVLRNIIIYKVDDASKKVTKITINKTNFERKYGINAVSLRTELFKDVDKSKINDTPTTYEII